MSIVCVFVRKRTWINGLWMSVLGIHCPRAGPGPVGPRVGPARPY